GKSSLLNRLAQSDALVADQPFATLDPTQRRAYLAPNVAARVVDTVGFITALPQELVTAFRATLEELEEAELLVHVVDISNPDWPRQKLSVESILHDLHLDTKRRLLVYNKCDRVGNDSPEQDALSVSARTGAGIEALKARLAGILT
ncbi:MAG: 50S ribosome-binding GTPase, partial [Candidatus Eremiobacteraeota bacterium]|nr:50S ribosome-binding GTPase [Candidatus Eremiobacteraeota bacterium]